MADTASSAKMKALAEYFRRGGQAGMNTDEFQPDPNKSDGRLSAAGPAGMQPPQNVPQWALHDRSAPEMPGAGAGTIDEMNAVREAQLKLNNLGSQQMAPEANVDDYKPWKGPRQFEQLRQKMQAAPPKERPVNIRDTLKGAVEMTPELERQLGYGKPEDEDEE